MSGFRYRERSPDKLDKRAEQGANDFAGPLADDFKTYSVKKGDNWIRILPPTWDNPEHYGIDLWVHYGIGPDQVQVVCIAKQPHPITGEHTACPICEARQAADKRGDEELSKELKPSKRVLVWMIDRREPEKGEMLWAMPWTLDRDIVKLSKDKRTGEVYVIDHPDRGYDVSFDKEGDKMQTKYMAIQISQRPSSVDQDILDRIEQIPLPLTLNWRDYETLAKMFSGGGGGERRERSDSTRDERMGHNGGPSMRDEPRRDDRRDPPRDDRRDRDEPARDSRRDDPPFDGGRRYEDAPRDDRRDPPREEPRREPPARRPINPPPADDRQAAYDRNADVDSTRDARYEREAPRDERRDPPPREAASQGVGSKADALRARFASKG